MRRAGLYIRVSTMEQAQEGYSIPAQREKLKAFCVAHDFVIVDEYLDPGATGANLDRPAMEKLIADVEAGLLDIVLVYKLDRLSRSQKDTLYLIEDVFLKNEVNLISMQESFDTSTPFGRAMVGILSVFAQLEREAIRERMMMGMHERAKEGLHHGSKMSPIGYEFDGDQLVINEHEAAQVRLIYKLFLEGKSMASIAKYMREAGYKHKYSNYRNTRTVANILSRAVYAGKIKYQDKYYEGQHEPIISKDVWDKTQEMLEQMRANQVKRSPATDVLLKDLLFCAHCGGKISRRKSGKTRTYYSCYSRHGSPAYMVKDPNCKNKIWKTRELDDLVSDQILQLAHNSDGIAALVKKDTKQGGDIKKLKKEIEKIDKRIDRLMALYQDDEMPLAEISTRVKRLHEDKKSLEAALIEQNKKDRPIQDGQDIKELLKSVQSTWVTATMEEKIAITQQLIKRIWVDNDNIKIEWSFI